VSVCAAERQQIFRARWLWHWLGPPVSESGYVMYFRFCGWRHFNTPYGAACVFLLGDRTRQAQRSVSDLPVRPSVRPSVPSFFLTLTQLWLINSAPTRPAYVSSLLFEDRHTCVIRLPWLKLHRFNVQQIHGKSSQCSCQSCFSGTVCVDIILNIQTCLLKSAKQSLILTNERKLLW